MTLKEKWEIDDELLEEELKRDDKNGQSKES